MGMVERNFPDSPDTPHSMPLLCDSQTRLILRQYNLHYAVYTGDTVPKIRSR